MAGSPALPEPAGWPEAAATGMTRPGPIVHFGTPGAPCSEEQNISSRSWLSASRAYPGQQMEKQMESRKFNPSPMVFALNNGSVTDTVISDIIG
ncbi:hypothetical protein [Rhodopila sp.]|uniref:hypothetical protein n=1 Tax=Rhodopila sp. TaxID=2480087 RepID=UPI003D146C6D